MIEQVIRMDFPTSNNKTEYETIIAGINLVTYVYSKKSSYEVTLNWQWGQVNREYKTRDQRMIKYVCLVKLRLKSFVAWKLKHIPRGSNEMENVLAIVVASLPIKEMVFPPVYYQAASSITTNQVNEINEACSS